VHVHVNRIRRVLQLASLLICCQLATVPAAADPEEGDPGRYPFFAAAYTVVPGADLESAGAGSELKAKETQFAAGLLQIERDDLQVDFGLDYQYTHYAYESIDGRDRDLHRLQFPAGLTRQSENWVFTGFIAPGIGTSSNVLKDIFDRGSNDDFLVTGRVEASFRRGGQFSWLGGLAYDRAFGEAKPYPVVGVLYAPTDHLVMRLALPDPSLGFTINDRHEVSLRLFPAGFEWHVVSDELNDRFWYRVEAIRLQGTWSFRFARSAWLDLSLGYEFDRRHEFVDDTGRSIHSDLGNQALVEVGLRWADGPLPYTNEVTRLPLR
jgi:hypothetical protein